MIYCFILSEYSCSKRFSLILNCILILQPKKVGPQIKKKMLKLKFFVFENKKIALRCYADNLLYRLLELKSHFPEVCTPTYLQIVVLLNNKIYIPYTDCLFLKGVIKCVPSS